MSAQTTAGPLKPGRKLDPTLPLTAARLAQRAFRARKAERQSSLLEQVETLQQQNENLQARIAHLEQEQYQHQHQHQHQPAPPTHATYDQDRAPPPPAPGPTLLPVVLASRFSLSDLQFVTSFCPVPLPDIADPSPYIAFCLALIPSLPAPRQQPPPQAAVKPEDQCCGGLIDCSGPLFDQDEPSPLLLPPPDGRTFIAASVAWMHLAPHRRNMNPRDLVGMIEQSRRSGGEMARCDPSCGLQVDEAAVVAVRQSLEDYAQIH